MIIINERAFNVMVLISIFDYSLTESANDFLILMIDEKSIILERSQFIFWCFFLLFCSIVRINKAKDEERETHVFVRSIE